METVATLPEAGGGPGTSQLARFVAFCERATGHQFVDHAEFEAFAVQEYRRFWALLLQWCELITEGSADPVCVGEEPETAVFFGDLHLSYVENLLHIESDQDAERVAVVARHAARATQRLTRGELRDAVRRVAAHLRRLDVAPGDRVVAVANNNAELLIGALAAAAIGATFACASPDMGVADVVGRFAPLAPASCWPTAATGPRRGRVRLAAISRRSRRRCRRCRASCAWTKACCPTPSRNPSMHSTT